MPLNFAANTVWFHDLDLPRSLAAMQAAGFTGVEWRCRYNPPDGAAKLTSSWGRHEFDCSPDWLAKNGVHLRQLCADHGLAICALAANAGAHEPETLRKLADGAAAAGCTHIKVGCPEAFGRKTEKSYQHIFTHAVEQYGRVVELFAPYKIRPLIETHPNTIHTSASMALRLAEQFHPREVGIIWDLQNSPEEGYELPRLAISLMGPYLAHVHVGGRRWVDGGTAASGFGRAWQCDRCRLSEGVLDLPAIFAELLRAGFNGFVALEDFRPGETLTKLAEGMIDLRAALAVAETIAKPA